MKAPTTMQVMQPMKATMTGNSNQCVDGEKSLSNSTKDASYKTSSSGMTWQLEMLMERLRAKSHVLAQLPDFTKSLRTCILNKQHLMDTVDRNAISAVLDNLQENIPVSSLDGMIERLEATARQLGLKFTSSRSTHYEVYVSCDMFYVEVLLMRDGTPQDVRVEFAGDSNVDNMELGQSCPELIHCLSERDFKQFTAHLEGFLAMYTLNTEDKKAKLRTQFALKALETDLTKLFELAQETIPDMYKLVLKSPVGLLQPRRGGQSMRLVYFVSPYELLDENNERAIPLTTSTALTKQFKHHVQLRITATSDVHKLQLTTLMQVTTAPDAKKLPSFSGLTASNSFVIPSVFMLNLEGPMPMSLSIALRIADVTGIHLKDISGRDMTECGSIRPGSGHLLDLIVSAASNGSLGEAAGSKGLFVTLPDQQHCYFMSTEGYEFPGMMVSGIPFTHPTHITSILMLLRSQAAFNTLISSCVRPNSKQELDSAHMFEITSLSHEYISVTFEHPLDDSTATAELDLTDLCNVRCRLHSLTQDAALCSEEYATTVLQRCLSIPITMRAVLRKVVREERKTLLPTGDSLVMSSAPSDINQNSSKFILSNDYDRLGATAAASRRDHFSGSQVGGPGTVGALQSALVGRGSASNASQANTGLTGGFFTNVTVTSVKNEGGAEATVPGSPRQKASTLSISQHHFLEDVKAAKVRKRKLNDSDHKGQFEDEVVEVGDPGKDPLDITDFDQIDSNRRKAEKPCPYDIILETKVKPRDLKSEKQNFLSKRRSSSDYLPTSTSAVDTICDLDALREKVYGAGSAQVYAQFNLLSSSDLEAELARKPKKPRHDHTSSSTTAESSLSRKSPIVLDLTKSDSGGSGTKKSSTSSSSQSRHSSGISSGSGSTHSSSSPSHLSTSVLLKRPGIEIFPIAGSSSPISIPSSITVTPVLKSTSSSSLSYSSDDKHRDKKDRKDKRDSSKDAKRKRYETAGSSSSSSSSSKSKVDVMSSSVKHSSSLPSLEKLKNDSGSSSKSSSPSGLPLKPGSPPYHSPSKPSSSSSRSFSQNSISKSSHSHTKMSYSPTHKSNSSSKTLYNPCSHSLHSSSSSPKTSGSPKLSNNSSPKHAGLSPKYGSSGKPSLSGVKSSGSSSISSYSKSSLSPKLSSSNSGGSSKGSSSCSGPSLGMSSSSSNSNPSVSPHHYSNIRDKPITPTRTHSSVSAGNTVSVPPSSSSGALSNTGAQGYIAALSKSKVSVGPASSGSADTSKQSHIQSDTSGSSKVAPEATGSTSGHSFFKHSDSVASSLQEKSPFLFDKAKASPPKNRKGSCLSDIVDKLRAGVSGSSDSFLAEGGCDKESKIPSEPKKEPDKTDYTIKPLDGLKLSINKSKMKEMKDGNTKVPSSGSSSPSSLLKNAKSSSGLKPGVLSGPASKKVSMSSLPPIPKLSSASVSTASVSPLSSKHPSSSQSMSYASTHTSNISSSCHQIKDRIKEKSFTNSGNASGSSSSSDRSKLKDSVSCKSDSKRESGASLNTEKLLSSSLVSNLVTSVTTSSSVSGSHCSNKRDDRVGTTPTKKDPDAEKLSGSVSLSSKKLDMSESSKSNYDKYFSHNTAIPDKYKSAASISNDSSSQEVHKNHFIDSHLNHYNSSMSLPTAKSGDYSSKKSDVGRNLAEFSNSRCSDDFSIIPPTSLSSSSGTSLLSGSSLVENLLLAKGGIRSELVSEWHGLSNKSYSCNLSSTTSSSAGNANSTSIALPPPPPPPPLPPNTSSGSTAAYGHPLSPSLSIKIVKSPLASPITPLSLSSQHSPYLIDDDLMEEAILGPRK